MLVKQSNGPTNCLYCQKERIKNSSLIYFIANDDGLCENCRKKLEYAPCKISVNEIEVQSYYHYNEMMKSLILQYKECYDEALKDVFFYPLKEKLRLKYAKYTIVPVPSSKSNLERRGFNHVLLMCETIGLPMADILEKIVDKSQNNLNYTERIKMTNNIRLKENAKVPEKILLVDDILTTGSSILGAYKVLKPHSHEVIPLTLSYVNRVVHSKI